MRKLGMNAGSFEGISALNSLTYIKSAGFDSFFTGFKDDETVGKIAEEAAKKGLIYETIHAPFKGIINNIWKNTEEGEETLGIFKSCADACAHYDIPVMVVHLSAGSKPPCVNDIGRSRWDRLVEHAGNVGVTIAFENQRKLANLAFVFELYDDVPHVKFCWDNGHETCFAHSMEYMPLFGKKTVALHIHDNMKEHNQDIHLLPFDGAIDFNRVADHIRNSGFEGTVMLEALPKNSTVYVGYTPEQYYERAYNAASRLRSLIDNQ